jgi:hypothetical protein
MLNYAEIHFARTQMDLSFCNPETMSVAMAEALTSEETTQSLEYLMQQPGIAKFGVYRLRLVGWLDDNLQRRWHRSQLVSQRE